MARSRINTAIVGPTGANVGIGFAIPVDMALNVAAQLIEHGSMDRGRIGVQYQELTPELAAAFGLEPRPGALISQIVPGSPAEAAGLQVGDIIVSLDGEPLARSSDLRTRVGMMRAGTEITLGVLRDGQEISVDVLLRSPAEQTAAEPPAAVPHAPLAGLELAPTPENRGLVICDPHSPWQRGGIENGNGLYRRDLPRHADLSDYDDTDIDDIVWMLNSTPRKCLGFQTPIEAFAQHLGVALEK